jgi:hypothetical protein
MVTIGAIALLAYAGLVVALIVRNIDTERPGAHRGAVHGGSWHFIRAGRDRLARLMARTRTDGGSENEALRAPLAEYRAALHAAVTAVEVFKPESRNAPSDQAKFEELAIQALVAAQTLRKLADAAGACADACVVAARSHVLDPAMRVAPPRTGPPQHWGRGSTLSNAADVGWLDVTRRTSALTTPQDSDVTGTSSGAN